VKINLGCGQYKLRGFRNVDADPACCPDVVATVPPLPFTDGEADEVYCGHLLEHFPRAEGLRLLRECYRVLQPGGQLGVVVPNTRLILRRWMGGATTTDVGPDGRTYAVADLDDVCALWLFSTCQASPHRWAYDATTLERIVEEAGFRITGVIDPRRDPRLSNGNWYNLGCQAERP
jgi:predicted SAM-dependent methyltransferase